jgi:hypothetical protein
MVSASWNTRQRPWRTTCASILTGFSRNIASDHWAAEAEARLRHRRGL